MAFSNMIAEMRGAVSGYSSLLARTHLNEAWKDIRNMKGWSFQLGTAAFSTPGIVNAGTVTIQQGTATVIGDAAATAAWLTASTPASLLTNRQFRTGAGTIYSIIRYDDGTTSPADPDNGNNYPFATLTLDRLYMDAVTTATPNAPIPGVSYSIYQCYYPTPVADFEAWEDVADVINVINLECSGNRKSRIHIDRSDPQRQIFSNPTYVLPYQTDQRVGSSTYGWMLYELYPQPQAQYTYQTWFTRSGADLVNPGDTLPYPITEHVVKALARCKAYEWAEANKDPANPRGDGADYRFLVQSASTYFNAQIKEIRSLDRDRVDMWTAKMTRIRGWGQVATFDPATGIVSSRNM